MKYTVTYIIAVLLFSATPAKIHAGQYTLSIDNVVYQIYGSETDKRSFEQFHSSFIKASYSLFQRFNIKRPNTFKVNIAIGAWQFKRISGGDGKVSGLYDPGTGEFYFQRPAALIRKGILKRVVYHEMVHCVIREGKGKLPQTDANSLQWLEESFCEMLYPSIPANHMSSIPINRLTYYQFKKRLQNYIVSKEPDSRLRGYSLAQKWGRFLKEKVGVTVFFKLLFNKERDKVLAKHFSKFKKLNN